MRRDIFNKNERIAELSDALAQKAAAAAAQLAAERAKLEGRLAAQEAAAQKTEDGLRGEVDSLARELAGLEAFTQAKDDLERSQLTMRAENDALKAKLDKAEQEEERR
jgi:ABC-type transporter Mla subunit MlaD